MQACEPFHSSARCTAIHAFPCTTATTGKSVADTLGYDRESKDVAQLSSLGHFLKGSSATLGLTKVKDACEKIQHYGAFKDETGTTEVLDKELCLERIKKTMVPLKQDYAEAEIILKRYYGTS